MKGFFIDIHNGLLDPKHVKSMGSAVWEFMWCLDKVTQVDEEEIGWVLGGKPVNLNNLANELGRSRNTVSRNLSKLEKARYIFRVRTPYGIVITVAKTKKRFTKSGESRITKIVESRSKNGECNKDNTVDNTVYAQSGPWTKRLLTKLEKRRGVKISNVGRQLKALGELRRAGLSESDVWDKLLQLEKKDDFWKENPPDYANLSNNLHKINQKKKKILY